MSTATRPSPATVRAVRLVAERRSIAEAIGTGLAEAVTDPDRFAIRLDEGLRRLADPEYVAGQRRVAPGIGPVLGVRWPLLAAVARGFRQATRGDSDATLLLVTDRLFREPWLEERWFAIGLLERTVTDDPERTWQFLRRAGRESGDWITVDTLAHPVGRGILAEPYRWSELEQLVFSPSRWERRLVGSTIATIPFVDRRRGRTSDVAEHGLGLLGQLMGDSAAEVQKALAWAYRSMVVVDRVATLAALRSETERAVNTDDGHRAWVIRDTLPKLEPAAAAELCAALIGIRRRSDRPSTSRASRAAASFGPLPEPRTHPNPPLVPNDLLAAAERPATIAVSQESTR
jgi:3-methyladenine DNA glycosylase AlkD